jgi:hypothetical protein
MNMWRIAVFVPAAALRLLLAWVTLGRHETPSRKHTIYLTLALTLLAWLSIVLPMQFQSGAIERYRFVAQRDIGYFIGSALFLCAPFAVVSILSLAARRLKLGKVAASSSALVLAAAGSIFIPSLFAAGLVIGCVFAGYPSCM